MIQMKMSFRIVLLCFSTLILVRCGVSQHTPIVTIESQIEKLHGIIEGTSAEKYAGENYQSLAFGDLKVYKPEAFVQLDSIYRIKKEYLDKNDLRGLHKSGIEDLIPGYRTAAQEQLQEVKYEIEHLFQTSNEDSLKIYHSFYLFDYKDSLISVTPFYNFRIPQKYKDLYYAYQFDYHFVTNRDLYISKAEMEFIWFFKQREIQLIGEDRQQVFMDHTMKLMDVAKKAQTIDFREVSKYLVINELKRLNWDAVIEKFGPLFAVEENELIQAYELEIEWLDELSRKKTTVFSFSPYLEITDVKTN